MIKELPRWENGALPPWDGGPHRVVSERAITKREELLEALVDGDLPGLAGEDIAEALKNGAFTALAAGEVAVTSLGEQGVVILWLPFFEDEWMYVGEEQYIEHKELPPPQRWRDTQTAIAALSLGLPTRPIELGFVFDEQRIALPWYQFCRQYDLPPQYVVAGWE